MCPVVLILQLSINWKLNFLTVNFSFHEQITFIKYSKCCYQYQFYVFIFIHNKERVFMYKLFLSENQQG